MNTLEILKAKIERLNTLLDGIESFEQWIALNRNEVIQLRDFITTEILKEDSEAVIKKRIEDNIKLELKNKRRLRNN